MRGKFRWTRARKRVLLALLSDAGNLSGYPISRAAQASSGTVYVVLDRLEDDGLVTTEWEDGPGPRRRFYRLTPEGRTRALGILRLTEGLRTRNT